MKTVIVLPTYNEKENIDKLIKRLEKIFKKIPKPYQMHLLVVDDNSPDNTAEVVKSLSKKWRWIHLLTGKKKGLGAAYVRGLRYAIDQMGANILFEMDADLSHDPKLVPLFLRKIEDGYDFVIGSRYIKGGSIPENWAFHRKIFSVIGNMIVRFGLFIPSIYEWTNGYRAFKSSVFTKVGTGLEQYPGYTFQVAFLHRVYQAGFSFAEIPIKFTDRNWGKSKIVPPDYIYNVILYVLKHSTLIRYLIVGAIGFTLQIIISFLLVENNFFPGIAVAIGSEIAIVSNFLLNNIWTFAHKQLKGKKRLLTKFTAFQFTSIGAVIIQIITVSILTILMGKAVWFWTMVFSIVFLVIPYNFFIYNRYIWKTKK